MEQLYLIEIFIDKVSIFASEENEKSGARKILTVKIKFGPKVQFIITENQVAPNKEVKDDIIETDENGKRKWSRIIRVGKSYLFPSYPDTIVMILEKFPLEIEVWDDDQNEENIFIGLGTMQWDTKFFHLMKEAIDPQTFYEPLTIKTVTTLYAECCCKQVGEITFILRISPLGDSIVTDYQQLMTTPDSFVFRTNKAPSVFECKRIEGDNPNFCMVGAVYETATIEDPEVTGHGQHKVEVCTELQSCGMHDDPNCRHEGSDGPQKKYPIDKIRMGDITGPCGNANCPLARKVRHYIRALDTYKKEAAGKVTTTKDNVTSKVCGSCCCKDDRYHREDCKKSQLESGAEGKAVCSGCGGLVPPGTSCEDRKQQHFDTGVTPKGSKTQVAYVFSVHHVPDFKESMFNKNVIVGNMQNDNNLLSNSQASTSKPRTRCCCKSRQSTSGQYTIDKNIRTIHMDDVNMQSDKNNLLQNRVDDRNLQYSIYNKTQQNTNSKQIEDIYQRGVNDRTLQTFEVRNYQDFKTSQSAKNVGTSTQPSYRENVNNLISEVALYHCTDIPEEKDCRCDPPKPTPPCKTFDCDCIAEVGNIAMRKVHKPYCPSYKHKSNCPVTMMHEEEEGKKEDDEDEIEALPYGLPPIKLGPCPVMGRPCTVPDGFARMYKVAVQPPLPPSYSEAGKVCCSREYERIKKALKEYMKHDKENDFRCINTFNIDTERRCCDKEQRLLALMGKACCGSHKMSIQEKFNAEKK